MLRVESLAVSLGGTPILDDVALSVAPGRLSVLLGPNGVGKSTLYRCVMGVLPYTGRISIDGESLAGWPARRLAREVAYVPQEHGAAFSFLVRDVVLMGRNPHRGGVFGPARSDLEVAFAALDRLGLTHLAERSYLTLSGGQRQLVLIARALAQGARYLLLDEPTASLDFGNQMAVWQVVRDLVDLGHGAMVCTHDPNHALWFADDAIVMHRDGATRSGPVRSVVDPDLVGRLYGLEVGVGVVGGRTVVVPTPQPCSGVAD